ncbi:MAG: aminotransferase class I/II-fold pyridoxal phosphate-dependent enzyme, partial [Candidatus Heimdallarchaeaceae archaeon]
MKSQEYLSKKSLYLDERIDLSGGTKGWNTKSKEKANEISGFINATVGTARNNDGSLLIFPTLLEEFGKLSGEQNFAYANIRGMPKFAKLWKEDTLASFPNNLIETTDRLSSLPLATCGLTGGLTLAGEAFLDRDDPILIPNFRWGNIGNVFLKNQQLKEINYELLDEEGELNFSDLTDKIKTLDSEGKKFSIYLNFPNNPSGISPSFEQIKILQEALSGVTSPTIILLDDAYEGYVYDSDAISYSLFPHLVGLNENVMVVKMDGVSKRYCAYGARLGAIT